MSDIGDKEKAEMDKAFLSSLEIEYGFKERPWVGILYGQGGTGKSWLAATAPKPFIVPIENGAFSVPNTKRFNVLPQTIGQFFLMGSEVRKLKKRGLDIETVIFDTISMLEPMIWADVIKNNPTIPRGKKPFEVKSIVDYDYGQGFDMAMEYWERIIVMIHVLRDCGLNVLIIAHSTYRNINDEHGTRKFIDLSLKQYGGADPAARLKQESDWVYYVESEVSVSKLTANEQDKRRIADRLPASRYVNTRGTMLFTAKVRTEYPELIPNQYILDDEGIVSKKIFADLNAKPETQTEAGLNDEI